MRITRLHNIVRLGVWNILRWNRILLLYLFQLFNNRSVWLIRVNNSNSALFIFNLYYYLGLAEVTSLEHSHGYNKYFRAIYVPLQNYLSSLFHYIRRFHFRVTPDQHHVNHYSFGVCSTFNYCKGSLANA